MIDREAGLVFQTEKQLFDFFQPQVDHLENEYKEHRPEVDADLSKSLDQYIEHTLNEPAEIWYDDKTFKEFPIFYFIRPIEEQGLFYVAISYVSSEDEPTFVFFHFATRSLEFVDRYRRGDLVYDRMFEEVGFGAIDGDGLSEGDPMAMGLFISMLKVRSDSDVGFDRFRELGEQLREETIQSADEIWRTNDMKGNTLVTFIKSFPEHEISDLWYVAVTIEDQENNVHTLMFSFPTVDDALLDRYRHGENMQAEEISQESSH